MQRFNHELLVRARTDLDLTQEALAASVGVDVRTYRRYETGAVNNTTEGFAVRTASRRRFLAKLSSEIGVKEEELVTDQPPSKPKAEDQSSDVSGERALQRPTATEPSLGQVEVIFKGRPQDLTPDKVVNLMTVIKTVTGDDSLIIVSIKMGSIKVLIGSSQQGSHELAHKLCEPGAWSLIFQDSGMEVTAVSAVQVVRDESWAMPGGTEDQGEARDARRQEPHQHHRYALRDERDIEERLWLTHWRAGDPDAGAHLYDRHSASVTRYFNGKVFGGDVTDVVKDLVHTAFLTLQKTRDEVEHSVRAYIYGVAHNELRHHIRTARRDNRRQDRLQQAVDDSTRPSESSSGSDLEAAFGEKQAQRLVGDALRRLELDDQVLLELHYWEELPRVEIAAVLGVPEGTMANRIKAARERLATKMVELSPSIAALELSKTYTTWLAELTPHIDVMRRREAEARAASGIPSQMNANRSTKRRPA